MRRTNKNSRGIVDFFFIGVIGLLLLWLRRVARRSPVVLHSESITTQISSPSASLQQQADSVNSVTDEIALDANNKVASNIVDTPSAIEESTPLQDTIIPDPTESVTQENVAGHETEDILELDDSAERTQAYCVKCREKREMQDPERIVTKNGRNALEGTCPVCGTKLFRFIAR
jgi:hypothetical protein